MSKISINVSQRKKNLVGSFIYLPITDATWRTKFCSSCRNVPIAQSTVRVFLIHNYKFTSSEVFT